MQSLVRPKMSAIVQTEYGSPEVLRLAEVDRPSVSSNTVLVRIRATSVHAGDWHLMRGQPFLVRFIFGGLRKPKIQVLGTDMAGVVEAIGSAVTQFKVGDEVYGDLSEAGFGGFAEYVAVPETALVLKPKNLSFEAAAAVPVSALAALNGLISVGQLQSGQQVLINGASGGVGSYAVQIAKAQGAIVTAVCRAHHAQKVQAWGADHVIDYTTIDPPKTEKHYDLILDNAGYRSVLDYLPILKPQGRYILVGGSTARFFQVLFLGRLFSKLTGRNFVALVSTPNQANLETLKTMIEAEQITPRLDQHYGLHEIPIAIHRLEQRQVVGKISISIP